MSCMHVYCDKFMLVQTTTDTPTPLKLPIDHGYSFTLSLELDKTSGSVQSPRVLLIPLMLHNCKFPHVIHSCSLTCISKHVCDSPTCIQVTMYARIWWITPASSSLGRKSLNTTASTQLFLNMIMYNVIVPVVRFVQCNSTMGHCKNYASAQRHHWCAKNEYNVGTVVTTRSGTSS